MRTEKRTVYILDNGDICFELKEARARELRFKFAELLENTSVGRGGVWDQETFIDFILENVDKIATILQSATAQSE